MANAKFADMVDPRLLEAAWHRFESARELVAARRALECAKEHHQRKAEAHMRATDAYNNLEADIARGVRIGAGGAS